MELHPFTLAVLRAGLEAAGLPPGEYDIDATTVEKVAVDGKIFLERAGSLLDGHNIEKTARQWWECRNYRIDVTRIGPALQFISIGSGHCYLCLSPDGIVRHY